MSIGRKRPSAPEEEQLYRSVFEAAGDGLIIHDAATGRVVEANPAAVAMHGYSRKLFIGLYLTDYVHPDSQRIFGESAEVIQSDGVFESPALHMRRNGSSFYVEVRRTALTYQARPCLLSVVRDISE